MTGNVEKAASTLGGWIFFGMLMIGIGAGTDVVVNVCEVPAEADLEAAALAQETQTND